MRWAETPKTSKATSTATRKRRRKRDVEKRKDNDEEDQEEEKEEEEEEILFELSVNTDIASPDEEIYVTWARTRRRTTPKIGSVCIDSTKTPTTHG